MRRRRLLTIAAAVGCATSALACSVLLDWNGFTLGDEAGASDGGTGMPDGRDAGDAGEGGNVGDGADAGGETDATPLTPCGTDKLCAPAVPSVPGWQGPYTLFTGTPGAPSPCDPSSYESTPVFTGYTGLNAPNPACSCSCAAPAGVACATPQVTFYSDVCNTACGSPVALAGCVATPTACPNFKVGDSVPEGGACTASSTPAPPAVTWAGGAQVCQPQGASQGSCTPGELCLSEGSGAFCIMQAGMVTCPAGDYSVSHVYYGGATDTRACSACTCGPVSGASCSFASGPLGFPYLDPMCATAPTGALVLDSCIVIPTVKAVELKATAMLLDAGGCAPSGGVASGTATPAQPTTLCCTR
jgi:hypothetical protein